VDEIRQSIGADSLSYITLDELIEATTIPAERLCAACFSGEYPIALPDPEQLGKHLLEGYERTAVSVAPPVETLPLDPRLGQTVSAGAEDALTRP
jgi:amidophosphoribosyltransferase